MSDRDFDLPDDDLPEDIFESPDPYDRLPFGDAIRAEDEAVAEDISLERQLMEDEDDEMLEDDPWTPEMEEEYSDSQRFDEMDTIEDYNRFEEGQVFQDREWED